MGVAVSGIVFAVGALSTMMYSSSSDLRAVGIIIMVVGAVGFVISAWNRAMGDSPERSVAKLSAHLLGKRRHRAEMYVYALPARREARTPERSDVSQWRFFVVPSGKIDGRHPRAISEPMLTSVGEEVRYSDLPDAVRRASESESESEPADRKR